MTVNAKDFFSYAEVKQAADYIQSNTKHQPNVNLILGSGLGQLAKEIKEADHIPYEEIPNFIVSGVPGHVGKLVIGKLAGQTVLAMQGRTHFYEGYSMQHITLPVRVMQIMGLKS